MTVRKRLAALFTSSFVRDVAKLASGTMGGRLIALAALPIVTRLYSPEDFALLAVYLGVVSTVAVVACLRLEIAIPLAADDGEAANLLALSLLITVMIGGLLLAAVLVAPVEIAAALGQPSLAPYGWLIPLGITMAGSYSALQYWATRKRHFNSIALTRVTQAAAGVGTMLGLGWAGMAPLGLLLGHMLNAGSGGARLALDAWKRDGIRLRAISTQDMKEALSRHHRYPLFSTPEALANMAGRQVPVILIAAFSRTEAGFLLLALQVMSIPITLLGSSIGQVYVSQAAEKFRAGRLADFTLEVMSRLILLGAAPLILAGWVAPTLVPLIFGSEWLRTGEIVTWMVPWILLQLIASPVSGVMFVKSRQGLMLALTSVGAFLRIGSLIVVDQAVGTYHVEIFAISSAFFYAICLIVFMKTADINKSKKGIRVVIEILFYITIYISVAIAIPYFSTLAS